jgi:hypothetical protein
MPTYGLGISLSWVAASPSVPLLSVGQGTLDAVPRSGGTTTHAHSLPPTAGTT